jgi:hypothetical protein
MNMIAQTSEPATPAQQGGGDMDDKKVHFQKADRVLRVVLWLAVWLSLVFVVLYLLAVFFSYTTIFDWQWLKTLKEAVDKTSSLSVGVPCAAVAAVAIVALMLACFPGQEDPHGKGYTIKFASLDFSGPAGPVTLWLLVFGAFMLTVYELRDKPKSDTTTAVASVVTGASAAERPQLQGNNR